MDPATPSSSSSGHTISPIISTKTNPRIDAANQLLVRLRSKEVDVTNSAHLDVSTSNQPSVRGPTEEEPTSIKTSMPVPSYASNLQDVPTPPLNWDNDPDITIPQGSDHSTEKTGSSCQSINNEPHPSSPKGPTTLAEMSSQAPSRTDSSVTTTPDLHQNESHYSRQGVDYELRDYLNGYQTTTPRIVLPSSDRPSISSTQTLQQHIQSSIPTITVSKNNNTSITSTHTVRYLGYSPSGRVSNCDDRCLTTQRSSRSVRWGWGL